MTTPIKPIIGDLVCHRGPEGGWVSYGETYLHHDGDNLHSIGKAAGNVPRMPTVRPVFDCRIDRAGVLYDISVDAG